MGALTPELQAFLDAQPAGVLATITADGRARQSLVYFARDGERLLVSTLADRLKTGDVRRTGWASLCVMGHEPPYPSATLSGPGRDPHAEHRRARRRLIAQQHHPMPRCLPSR